MSDDIVSRLREGCIECGLPANYTACVLEAADEIERLRADRDTWLRTSAKLVGMMLPFSLLMKVTEQEELIIILQEATRQPYV